MDPVEAKDLSLDLDSIEWTPPARPLIGEVRGYAPLTDSPNSHAELDYDLEVG